MSIRQLKDRASELLSRGRFRRSREAWAELIDLNPGDPRLRLRYADACQQLGLDREAAASFHSAGVLFAAQNQWRCARAALRLAAQLSPSEFLYSAELAHAEELARQGSRAISALPPPSIPA